MEPIVLSRAARVREVAISSDQGGQGLPTITVSVCVVEVAPLPHEHFVVELTPAVLDAIETARSQMADRVIAGSEA